MDRTRLPDDILALNTRLRADPALTENMGPVHLLTVVGRRSGKAQTTPVSPVTHYGDRWLVAGWADADWVKNLRASGRATLTKGTRVEEVRTVEVPPEQGALPWGARGVPLVSSTRCGPRVDDESLAYVSARRMSRADGMHLNLARRAVTIHVWS